MKIPPALSFDTNIVLTFFSIFKYLFSYDNKTYIVGGGAGLVDYSPLWRTMEQKQITTYTLITKYGINTRTIFNLKHNKGITVYTLEKLCKALQCTPNDVLQFTE